MTTVEGQHAMDDTVCILKGAAAQPDFVEKVTRTLEDSGFTLEASRHIQGSAIDTRFWLCET